MAEEIKPSGKGQQAQGDVIKGDLSTILIGVGTLLDSTIAPLSKFMVQTLESLSVVAKQILEGVNSSLNGKK